MFDGFQVAFMMPRDVSAVVFPDWWWYIVDAFSPPNTKNIHRSDKKYEAIFGSWIAPENIKF